MLKNSTCFVAGGRTGFIGSNITKALLKEGAQVFAMSKSSSKKSFFDLKTPDLIQFAGDMSESIRLDGLGVDYVFNCAAHTSGAHEMVNNPVAQITENLFMNSRLLDTAAKNKVKKFIFISSSAIYPDSEVPLTEDMGFVDEPPPTYFGPAWMKRYIEKLAEFYYKQYGMKVVIIRPSNVYGPMCSFDLERSHVLPALIRKFVEKQNPLEVWGSPDVVRDFIYIDDFVEGVLKAFNKSDGFDVYNIASGHQYTIGEAVDIIAQLTDYKGKIAYNSSKPMTIKQRKIDMSKALVKLNFKAKTLFMEGLKRTIEWYRDILEKEEKARHDYNLYGR
jgi:GDP-L-fucose synthase